MVYDYRDRHDQLWVGKVHSVSEALVDLDGVAEVYSISGGMTQGCSLSAATLAAKRRGTLPLVADIKPASPGDGELVGPRDATGLGQTLVEAGACAHSVVTEPRRFGGNLQTLRRVCDTAKVPVLRKDFFSSAEQIRESKEKS